MSSSVSYLRQLSSGRETYKSTSWRWGTTTSTTTTTNYYHSGGGCGESQMEELNNMYGGDNGGAGGMVVKKRVMVLVDQSSHSKHAMMWALTHVANQGDLLTLLHIIPHNNNNNNNSSSSSSSSPPFVANSLGALCKACKPEVRQMQLL